MELPTLVQQELHEGSCDHQKMRIVGFEAKVVPKSMEEKRQEDIRVDACSLHTSINQTYRAPSTPMGKERRKVGRPIVHKGDPEDPALTEKERRRLKRRLANRESARRVRNRRREEKDELQIRMDEELEINKQLRQRHAESLQEMEVRAGELEKQRGKFETAAADKQKLVAEIEALRQSLQVNGIAPDVGLENSEAAAGYATQASAFGTTTVRPISAAMTALPSQTAFPEEHNNGVLMFPSLNLDGQIEMELLPSVDLNALLETIDPATYADSPGLGV